MGTLTMSGTCWVVSWESWELVVVATVISLSSVAGWQHTEPPSPPAALSPALPLP